MIQAGIDDSVFSSEDILHMTTQALLNITDFYVSDPFGEKGKVMTIRGIMMTFPADEVVDIEDDFSVDVDLLQGALNYHKNN